MSAASTSGRRSRKKRHAFISASSHRFDLAREIPIFTACWIIKHFLNTHPGRSGFLLVVDGPSAVGKSTIVRGLLNLPDIHFDSIKKRLLSRKTHTPEQIAERLGNAADSTRYLPLYDLVVMNEGRNVSEVVEEIKNQFLARVGKEGRV